VRGQDTVIGNVDRQNSTSAVDNGKIIITNNMGACICMARMSENNDVSIFDIRRTDGHHALGACVSENSFSPKTSPNVVCCEDADVGNTYSSVLDRGEEGVDHCNECLGETCNACKNREAITANIDDSEDSSEDDTWGTVVSTGVISELVSQEGGRVGSREADRLRPNVLMVSAGRRLVEWAR
jgi:hypothetical protein